MTVRPQIWAHRGSSALAPENTLAAFDLAIRQKADGVELDVQISTDGVVVVCHDIDCHRLTGEPGLVSGLPLADLRRRNFAWHRPNAGFVTLPTLAEVFDLIRPTGLLINIELKNDEIPMPGLEAAVLDLVITGQMQDQVLLSSFNAASLIRLMEQIRERGLLLPCGYLFQYRLVSSLQLARRIGVDAIHPRHRLLHTPDNVSTAHAAGIRVHPWTVDHPGRIGRLMDFGVDAVITNRPDLAWQIRQSRQSSAPTAG